MLEGTLIMQFEYTGTNIAYNYNYTTLKDYGGEQPLGEDEAHEHFVYIALKPLNIHPDPVLLYYGIIDREEWHRRWDGDLPPELRSAHTPAAASAHPPEELGDTPEDSEDDLPLEMEF